MPAVPHRPAAVIRAKIVDPRASETLLLLGGTVLEVAARRVMSVEAQAKMNQRMYEEVAPEDHTRERGDFENAAAEKQ